MKIVIEIPDHIYEHAKNCSEDSNDEWDAMRAIAKGFPYEERPHGEWKKYGDKKEVYDLDGNKTWGQMRRCTNCGFIKTYVEDFGFYSICPNCGTDMRKGGEENE